MCVGVGGGVVVGGRGEWVCRCLCVDVCVFFEIQFINSSSITTGLSLNKSLRTTFSWYILK